MTWFERIRKFYNEGLWSINQVRDGVLYNKITTSQYKDITGEDY